MICVLGRLRGVAAWGTLLAGRSPDAPGKLRLGGVEWLVDAHPANPAWVSGECSFRLIRYLLIGGLSFSNSESDGEG